MKTDYLISVIIPVHNTAKYLTRAVESVRNQDLKEIEIILVDNVSTDGSSEICDEYAKIDSRIKVLHLSIADLSTARNEGLKISSAPYLGFIDSDDYIEPNMYGLLLRILVESQANMAFCDLCCEHEDGRRELACSYSGKITQYSSEDALRLLFLEKMSSSVCTKIYERALFNDLHFPEGFFYEDHCTIFKWISMCQHIVGIDFAFYHYMLRSDSICRSFSPTKGYHYFLADYSRWEFVIKRSLFEENQKKEFANLVVSKCLCDFKDVMANTSNKSFKAEIKDMRLKLRSFLSLTKTDIDPKYYKRLRKIAYFWPIYYFVRFYLKRGR